MNPIWENSGNQLNQRATSKLLSKDLYRVDWKGSQYLVKRDGSDWRIRHLESGKLSVITEKEGLGKEEAIDWIERNC